MFHVVDSISSETMHVNLWTWLSQQVDINLFDVGANVTKSLLALPLLLVVCLALMVISRPSFLDNNESDAMKPRPLSPPPGPKGFPVIGSLHLLAAFPSSPWRTFVQLRSIYGDVFRIQLGNTECVVVNSLDTIREVLVQKADHFSGRPNFLRYHVLFGGSRDKSLALCDWSKIQKLRRRLAMPYVFPRPESENFESLEAIIESELQDYVDGIIRLRTTTFDKLRFSLVTANIFFTYFCSKRYDYDDIYFRQMVERFSLIFDDINGGFALDFLPWLLPFYFLHLIKLFSYGQFIRQFLVVTLINGWHSTAEHEYCEVRGALDRGGFHAPQDFLDVVLNRTDATKIKRKSKRLTNEYALYELEDILGGHTAVSCFWARVLVQVAPHPEVQRKIRDEVNSVLESSGEDTVRLHHRQRMPYMRAVIMETLRVTTSPIVPHVAVQDTTIGGYAINKDTLVFLNNYYLNTSEEFWTSPEEFNPDRFLDSEGRLTKPDHFLPFGVGKRSCIGHQLVQSITFLATAKLLRHFDLLPSQEANVRPIESAKLSVHGDSVRVVFRLRSRE